MTRTPKSPQEIALFPLAWPAGQKRTRAGERVSNRNWTGTKWSSALQDLRLECDRSAIIDYQLSTGREPGSGRILDVGAALWFMQHDGKTWQLAKLASDRFQKVELNVKAIAMTLQRLRQVEDYGVYSAQEARQGAIYDALPPPDAPPPDWWLVLKISPDSPLEIIDAAYRALAKRMHPDIGGTAEAFKELGDAYARAKIAKGRTK